MRSDYMSDISEENKNWTKKITEFSYLLQRKGLRMMRRYYKHAFENSGIFTNYKKQIRHLTYEQMCEAIRSFIELEFPYLKPFEDYTKFVWLEESLKTLILCDRYNKQEPIIEGLDFTILRNVLNKFNTRNLINFFGDKCYSLLFVHYFEKNGQYDAYNQGDVEPTKLIEEMQMLYDEADKYVKLAWENFRRERYLELPVFSFNEEDGNQAIL